MGRPSNREQVEGTLLGVGGACIFATVAFVVRKDPLPVPIAAECRFVISWIVALVFMLRYRVSRGLQWFGPAEVRKWLFIKCAMSFVFVTLWWTAIRRAPVGDCIAIVYSAPILTSLLSRAFLGEVLLPEFPAQIGLVTLGVILVVDPPFVRAIFLSSDIDGQSDYTFVFLALAAGAVLPVVTRKAQNCSWIEIEHVSALISATLLDPSLLLGQYLVQGELPMLPATAPSEIGIFVLASIASFVGIAMQTKGAQLAEVGKASMFRYVEVPFAYLLQKFGTNEPVQLEAVLGSVLIILSCVLGIKPTPTKAQQCEAVKDCEAANDTIDDKRKALLGA
eukprot:gnl/TRDRNA2_/TRDRNA2_45260_c0_seq1.p1 gnl/TRDRNA2_/TRDRNA2_45260_c0~~gnl/TRDRNA2_/TRDRNA2_45260_c0_seq1.p1  ORF type:complete len:360 (-),score=56.40 gnl/TRDRNA2_/TRDRNA2_45260_c0_seq1:55-1062(-)